MEEVAVIASGANPTARLQDAVAKDADFAKLLSQQMEIAEMVGRNIAVGIDL